MTPIVDRAGKLRGFWYARIPEAAIRNKHIQFVKPEPLKEINIRSYNPKVTVPYFVLTVMQIPIVLDGQRVFEIVLRIDEEQPDMWGHQAIQLPDGWQRSIL